MAPLAGGEMESPLWIDTHAPAVEDLPQAELRDYLSRAGQGPINLVLHGPPGSGKTAAARAYARSLHEDPDNDLIEINVADFFDMTKKELRNDPRFAHFLAGRSDMAKGAMVNYVVKESAGYSPVSGTFKTLLLDNAEAMREDFQQALRRVMERHHQATQFILTTRQPSKLIAPLRSRCFPIPVRAPTIDETVGVLEDILRAEAADYDPSGVRFIAGHADGDLRTAILDAQAVVETADELTQETAYDVLREIGPADRIEAMLVHALDGEFSDARSILDDLLEDDGYGGDEVLDGVIDVARSRSLVDSARLAVLAGEVDFDLTTGTNDRLHIAHLLAELGAA